MNIVHEKEVLKSQNLSELVVELEAFIHDAAQRGRRIDEVERAVWWEVLRIGRHCLGQFLALHGTGDMGETIVVAGQEYQRLKELHTRRYVSIFGEFQVERTVYGSREGQKHEFVPLDNRLQLPANVFSYVLQDWDQGLCVEQAFGQANATVARMLGFTQSVASLEYMNQEMAQEASRYILNRPLPPAKEEGEIVVASADGKGVVMRRDPDDPAPPAHRSKGEKASQKRMATVGTVYTVDRYPRTAEQVVAALFRDEAERSKDRPRPQHKQVWASLAQDDGSISGQAAVFTWLDWELRRRNRGQAKETVYLCDGQETLWQAVADELPEHNATQILDLLHVTPRLGKAAHVFHKEKSREAETFVRERVLRVLQGKAAGVIRGLREMATKHELTGSKKKTMRELCGYLENNLQRMRYDEYLAAGYPIASGAIAGACRHLVKDRLERAGMHWTAAGAQAMLDVRSIFVSGQWEEYQQYRIELETQRLYPHREAAELTMAMTS
jgi:hypothetical protein